MKNGNHCKAIGLIGLFLLFGQLSAFAQGGGEKGSLPFKPLHELMYPDLREAPEGFVYEASIIVTASGKPLPPKDLELHLEVDDRRIPIGVSKEGVLRLPDNKEWAKEGVLIVSNQPKGSLTMSLDAKFSGTGDFGDRVDLRYRDVMRTVHFGIGIIRSASALMEQEMDRSAMKVWLQAEDFEGKKPVATVFAKEGKIEYPADLKGRIVMPFVDRLFDENPKVDVPAGTLRFTYREGVDKEEKPEPEPDPVGEEDV